MILRSLRSTLHSKLLFRFSQNISIEQASTGRFMNIMDRLNRKSRRKQINQFLQVRLESNYKLPTRKVSLTEELKKVPTGGKINDLFLDLNSTPIKFEPWERKVDEWYIKPRKEQLMGTFKNIANKFLNEILTERRDNIVRAEPNFELQLRRNVRSFLNSQGKITVTPMDVQQTCNVLFSEFLKGLKINRNENYEQQSYEIQTSRQNDGIFTYLPVKQFDDRFPQSAMQNINSVILKVVCEMNFPFRITITQKGDSKTVYEESRHLVAFENQLRRPPMFSEWRVSPEQYLKSYRFDKPWVVTDIDNSSSTVDYLYPFSVKTNNLVNELQQ